MGAGGEHIMNTADFDKWRQDYDYLTYRDQLAFYDRVAEDHPLQRGFDVKAFKAFFEAITLLEVQILEFGGWKGELAAEMLAEISRITQWLNLEISRKAVIETKVWDERYRAIILHRFAWEVERLPGGNVFVSSHAIEHIKAAELERLFGKLPPEVTYVGLQAPLVEGPTDWAGYYGSHILEVGWMKIGAILQALGFTQFMAQGEFRGYRR